MFRMVFQLNFSMDDSSEDEMEVIVQNWTHKTGDYEQRIYRGLKKDKRYKKKKLVRRNERATVLATISKGLLLLSTMISDNDINVTEWKAINSIVSAALPRIAVGGEEVKCKKLWNTYKNFVSRSNRRTNWWRLHNALQVMGMEIPELEKQIHQMLIRLYEKQIGQLGKDAPKPGFLSMEGWKHAQNKKPEQISVIGS